MTASDRPDTGELLGEPMVGFGGKQAWLAIRDGDPEFVLAALGLRDLGSLSWRAGVDLSYLTDDRVVLTPPLPGMDGSTWLLVAGRWLARPTALVDVEALSELMATEVQYFATDRVVERHRWQRARDGALLRSFSFVGDEGAVTAWIGDPDPAELAIGLPASDPADAIGEDANESEGEYETSVLVGEADVLRLAAAWSLSPADLTGLTSPGPLRAAAAPSPPGATSLTEVH